MSSAIQSSGLTGLAIPGGKISAVAAANALTIAIKTPLGNDPSPTEPLYTSVRIDPTSGSAMQGRAIVAPLTLVLSAGSTLGGQVGIPLRGWLVEFNDAGTLRLGVKNCSNGASITFPLIDNSVGGAKAEGGAGASDQFGAFYANVDITLAPYRIIGFMEWFAGFASVAGNWTAPDSIRLFAAGGSLPGSVVQDYSETTFSIATTTALIPLDNTIPQSSEGLGTGMFSTALIKPDSPCNFIEFDLLINVSHSVAGAVIAAIFRDTDTNATVAGWAYVPAAGAVAQLRIKHRVIAGDAASRGYAVRLGPVVAGTLTFNGIAAAAILGNRLISSLRVTEIAG